LWQVTAFRNYADYTATDAFRTGLNELRASRDNCCAIMCVGRDKIAPAKLTPGAQALPDGTVVYPAADEAAQPTD
jgi:hypothetical protein